MTMLKRCIVWASLMLVALASSAAGARHIPERVSTAPIPPEYLAVFEPCAAKNNLDVKFMAAVFSAGEHGGRWPNINGPWASSHKGANGPWQFMPDTWKSWGRDANGDGKVDVQNISDASCAAAAYLASAGARGAYGISPKAIEQYREASSRYNSGKPAWRGETFFETRPYMASVVRTYKIFYAYYKKDGAQPKVANSRPAPSILVDSMMHVPMQQDTQSPLNLDWVLVSRILAALVVAWLLRRWYMRSQESKLEDQEVR